MTNKDREKYIDVLLALAGHDTKEEKNDKPCQQNCQSNPQSLENSDIWKS